MSKYKPLPSIDYLKECFSYDKELGVLYWNERPISHFKNNMVRNSFNGRYAGCVAGSIEREGYVVVRLNKSNYKAHRIIMAMQGEDQSLEVDHIDGDRSNNKLTNLRTCSISENGFNRRYQSNNRSGTKGVYWLESENRWRVVIGYHGSKIYIGQFSDLEEAREAAASARDMYHGEFSNHG